MCFMSDIWYLCVYEWYLIPVSVWEISDTFVCMSDTRFLCVYELSDSCVFMIDIWYLCVYKWYLCLYEWYLIHVCLWVISDSCVFMIDICVFLSDIWYLCHDVWYLISVCFSGEDSVVTIGLGDSQFPLNKHPGKLPESTGYNSRDGHMYYNKLHTGNTPGERFGEGQCPKHFSLHWHILCL